jgi:endonuclease/exonuclease/phosphatase (EEP) superfamily protein YafD
MFLRDFVLAQLVYKFALASLILLVILTLASQFGAYAYLELTTHFRLQYFLGAIVCALLLTTSQSWKFVAIAVFCALLNAASIWPYYKKPESTVAASKNKLRLFHANVFEKSRDYQAVLDRVNEADADVVVLQELTQEWSKQTEILKNSYAYVEIAPRSSGAGMGVFSRYPLEDVQVLTLDSTTHVAILAKIKVNETALTLLSLHPTTPITVEKFRNRNQQFQEAAKLIRPIAGPRVLVGDLNTTMWSPYFRQLLADAGLRDARLGFGLGTTWPEPYPPFLRIAIDHCLVSNEVGVESMRVGPRTGSDHRPLIIDLKF